MIRILDKHVADSIAAGEVVEKPASVVKELVENALDAKASQITVEVKKGGIELIRVSDNGCGMTPADANLSFLRHATSKLSTITDLNELKTMGFRGEALASIAAVANVVLTTKTADAEYGYRIHIRASEVIETSTVASQTGTTLEVHNLFFNTPARYKFLKKDSTEAGYIQDLLYRLALGRPDVAFTLLKDGEEIFRTPGDGNLQSVIYVLFGQTVSKQMVPISSSLDVVEVDGFISRPALARGNRSRYYLLVNGRSIQSTSINAAIDEACRTWFMRGKFPQIVLKLKLPLNLVDVNVHPQKLQVKFWDENTIFRAVFHAVRDALDKDGGRITAASSEEVVTKKNLFTESKKPESISNKQNSFSFTSDRYIKSQENIQEHSSNKFIKQDAPKTDDWLAIYKFAETDNLKAQQAPSDSYSSETIKSLATNETISPVEEITNNSSTSDQNLDCSDPDITALQGARLIGQVFNTYLLLETPEHFLLIDQHAAHERVLYERFSEQRFATPEKIRKIELLEPLVYHVTTTEIAALNENSVWLNEQGFEFEPFGNDSVVLRTVPDLGKKRFSHDTFKQLIDYAVDGKLGKVDMLDELYHTMACKAAVKANDVLTLAEMEQLISDLQNLRNPYHCPHGRPVVIFFTREDLEKLFKRIV